MKLDKMKQGLTIIVILYLVYSLNIIFGGEKIKVQSVHYDGIVLEDKAIYVSPSNINKGDIVFNTRYYIVKSIKFAGLILPTFDSREKVNYLDPIR